ncbi:MAG: DUF4097 family beta strand repeat protein [Phycisphaerae bacterium]|nr:DUF4097 family beta strand repeat protein [Phycisphaerae bacterium]
MKRLLVISFTVAMLLAAGCGTTFRATREFSFTEPWTGYERVEVRTRNGSVELRSAAVDVIQISGTKRARGFTHADAESNLDRVSVHGGADAGRPDTFVIELRFPETLRHKSVGADIVVEVPEPCAAKIDTGNGSIHVAGLTGNVELDTSNGRILAEDLKGNLNADTSNGRIIAKRIEGRCRLDTSNGRIIVENVRGVVEADTSNGDIRADVAPPPDGRVELHTSNGSIHVTVPEGQGADLRLKTSNGRIKTMLGDATLQRVEVGKTSFRAQMNGGGGVIVADTSNGSITIDLRGGGSAGTVRGSE